MDHHISRRLAAFAAAATIAFVPLTIASPAQALTSPAAAAADWLSKQLTDGLAHNPNYGGFDDYGLSLDIFFALDALDAKPASADAIIDALEVNPSAYVGSGLTVYSGNLGKLATAAQLDGRNAKSFGGLDLIAAAEARVVSDGKELGRATDSFDPADEWGADYSNTFGQSWIVRALTTAGSPRADDVTAYLLKQQCDDGSFREALSAEQCTKGPGSIDATAFAVEALDAAADNGLKGNDADIADAVAWLAGLQAGSGAFSDAGAYNTNSTGLVASVLADHGHKAQAQKAARWVVGRQVTTDNAGKGPLHGEIGAIAYDSAALDAAKTVGITDAIEDQWRRATAQAAIGVNIALPAHKPPSEDNSGPEKGGSGASSGSFHGDVVIEPAPTESTAPVPTASPEPPRTAEAPDDVTTTAPGAAPASGTSPGWWVAGGAGVLMLVTAGAVGIGRLRGGGIS